MTKYIFTLVLLLIALLFSIKFYTRFRKEKWLSKVDKIVSSSSNRSEFEIRFRSKIDSVFAAKDSEAQSKKLLLSYQIRDYFGSTQEIFYQQKGESFAVKIYMPYSCIVYTDSEESTVGEKFLNNNEKIIKKSDKFYVVEIIRHT